MVLGPQAGHLFAPGHLGQVGNVAIPVACKDGSEYWKVAAQGADPLRLVLDVDGWMIAQIKENSVGVCIVVLP